MPQSAFMIAPAGLRARPPPDPNRTDVSKLEKTLTSVFCVDTLGCVARAATLDIEAEKAKINICGSGAAK
jgi:hypothetical protein